jgi:hypothetical protein
MLHAISTSLDLIVVKLTTEEVKVCSHNIKNYDSRIDLKAVGKLSIPNNPNAILLDARYIT